MSTRRTEPAAPVGLLAVDGRVARAGRRRRGSRRAISAATHGADRDDGRPLAPVERLELLARLAVSLLGLGVAALHRARRGLAPARSLRRARLRLRRSARLRSRSPPGATSPAGEGAAQRSGRRRSGRRRRGSPGPRRAVGRPASTTCRRCDGSIPPIANHGTRRVLGGVADQLEPGRRPARLRRRLPDRPDADLVDGRLGGGVELLRGVGREADDRVGPAARAPRRRRRRPGRRGRRRRRRRGQARGRR